MTQIISQLGSSDPASSFGSNTLPDFINVMGEWWFGGDASKNINSITGVSAVSGGSPVYSAGSVNLGNYPADSLLLDVGCGASDFTIVALVRSNADDGTAVVAADPGDPGNYNLTLLDVSHVSAGNGQTTGSTDQSILTIADTTKFSLVMGVYRLGQPSRIYMVTGAGTAANDGTTQYVPNARSMGPMRLGGNFNVNWGGHFDMAGFAILSESKSQSYAETLYPMWKAYAQSRGLTVA